MMSMIFWQLFYIEYALNFNSLKKNVFERAWFIASLEYEVIKMFNHSLHTVSNLILWVITIERDILQQIYRLGRC